ncbi:MAG: nucleoside hydrolase [Chloroflexota bacterium]
MTHRIVLDMDVGIDDAIAILFLATQPDVEIVALGATFGNVDTDQAARNAIAVFEAVGLGSVPVARGADTPLEGFPNIAWYVHGRNGLGEIEVPAITGRPTGEHAADQLIRLGVEHPGELDLLAVGPLTNLGLALRKDPDALARYRSVVIMGGSGPEPIEDTGLMFDANIHNDPLAADLVFSARGANTVMVGVNVTAPTILDEASIERIAAADTPQARLATAILPFYLDFYSRQFIRRVSSMHDPLAAGILLDPTLITAYQRTQVAVLQHRLCWRAVAPRHPGVGVPGRPTSQVITGVDGRRFIERLVDGLIAPLPQREGGR